MVHPQSVIHSMVEFVDGSTHRPGQPAGHAAADRAGARLAGPGARRRRRGRLDAPRTPGSSPRWTTTAFPAVALAKAAGEAGRCRPAIYNAANEECVAAFVAGPAALPRHRRHPERVLEDAPDFDEPGTVEDVLAAESWARAHAQEIIAALGGRSLMAYLLGVVLFALAILISVSLHEAGHMLTAKAFGMKVTQLLRRLRPDPLVVQAGRDRVRPQGASRSAASARSSG